MSLSSASSLGPRCPGWLLVSFICLFAAQAVAQSFNLTVINGSGSGVYPAGSVVDIWANPYEDPDLSRIVDEPDDPSAPLRVFDRWTLDTGFVTDVFGAHTTVTMPAANVQVVAHYKDAPRWNPLRAIWRIPPDARGVIFLFHGRFTNAFTMFYSAEQKRFAMDALARGYGVVALDSFDRVNRAWDEREFALENVDMLRVAQVRSDLIAQGLLTPAVPIYLMGISNGGMFASLFTAENQSQIGVTVAAAAIYIASGNLRVMATSEVPTIFVLAENDSTPNVLEGALTVFADLVSRDIPSQLWIHTPSPVYPERFWRVDEISGFDSHAIQASLANAGLLDADGFLIDHPDDSNWQQVVPAQYRELNSQLQEQLYVLYAEHRFMSDFNNRVLDFFDNPTTIVDLAPVVDGFSPQSGTIGTTVFVQGTNFVDVSEVTFNGVSAIFQVDTATQIRAAVPPGVQTGPVAVTNSVGTGIAPLDFVARPPGIDGFGPQIGVTGTLVTIDGSNFAGDLQVTFNVTPAPVISSTSSRIWVQVPDGAESGPIMVANPVGTATSDGDFTVAKPPIIDAMDPFSGPVGTNVILTGENLSGTTNVSMGAAPASFVVESETRIAVQVPIGASSGKIRLTTPGGKAASPGVFRVVN
jgi:dienelactone hydrolase